MAEVSRSVEESHEHRSASQLGERRNPRQEPGAAAEEGDLDGTGLVVVQQRRVDRDGHHLIGVQCGRCLRRDFDSARPWLDVRSLAVAAHGPGIDQVPESAFGR